MNQQSHHRTAHSIDLAVMAIGSFLTPFMGTAMNVALKNIGGELSMSAVLLGWVGTSFLLASAVSLVPIGKIADMVGRKKIFMWGVGVFTLGSLLCSIATTATSFIAFRVIQGIGSAFIFATSTAIVTSIFPLDKRGWALGIVSAAIYLGTSLGPVLGGFLTGFWGWRSIFWVGVLLGLVILPLVFWKLKGEWADAAGERFDWMGTAIYGVALAALMLGFTRLPTPLGIGLTLIGMTGIVLFVVWEAHAASPILNLSVFRHNTVFTFSNLAALINYSATAAVGFLLSLYLQHIKGSSPQQTGLILVAHPLMMTLLSPLAGRLSDRIASRTLASAGMALTTLALIPFIFLNAQTPFWAIILCLGIVGSGFGLFSSPNVNAIMSAVESKSYGIASATLATMRLIGQTLSMSIATLIFALYLGQVAITPEVYPQFLASIKSAFAVFALLCFLGIFASLARGNK